MCWAWAVGDMLQNNTKLVLFWLLRRDATWAPFLPLCASQPASPHTSQPPSQGSTSQPAACLAYCSGQLLCWPAFMSVRDSDRYPGGMGKVYRTHVSSSVGSPEIQPGWRYTQSPLTSRLSPCCRPGLRSGPIATWCFRSGSNSCVS